MQPSNFDYGTEKISTAFELLDEKIRRWVWEQGWSELRDVQEAAIPLILEEVNDIIIAAATASGKTEAAFLPICSKLNYKGAKKASVIYISPLKALINDQFSRVEQLCENLLIPVHPWHGDISASKKKKFLKKPDGIILITPESLEALFVNHGHTISFLFKELRYVVIDELHSFIGSERGCQLQSLLHRLESILRRKIPRIGLSATIGDMKLAANYLRPDYAENVNIIVSNATAQELQLLVKGYVKSAPLVINKHDDTTFGDDYTEETQETEFYTDRSDYSIGEALFKTVRGTNNLIFANSRHMTEFYADSLRTMCEEQHVPNEFWSHHGNLSKELREDAEIAIKEKTRPVSIICTSTLEMGIDIGSVKSIAQIDVPPSVSSLRQRLGRSGRRGEPAILRIYLKEAELTDKSSISDCLRTGLIQTIAMVRLLLMKWYEPPQSESLHLSTIIHQILAVISQYGGATAFQLWELLCKNGPFASVDKQMFASILRSMGNHELIFQNIDGLILHGKAGEHIVNHYTFYAVFTTPVEFRLVSGSRTLGNLPIDRPVCQGAYLIFGGRRWLILSVDSIKKVIELKPAKGGKPPLFNGDRGWVHDRIRQEMYKIYLEESIPLYLDSQAKELLTEARENFHRYNLKNQRILNHGKTTHLFLWMGDRVMDTITAMLRGKGLKVTNEGIALSITNSSGNDLIDKLEILVKEGMPDSINLSRMIENKAKEKYDYFLTDELLNINHAYSKLDPKSALDTIRYILEQ